MQANLPSMSQMLSMTAELQIHQVQVSGPVHS